MKNEGISRYKSLGMSIGMCLGVGIGYALGAIMGKVSLGMCIGMCLGMCIGMAIGALNDKHLTELALEIQSIDISDEENVNIVVKDSKDSIHTITISRKKYTSYNLSPGMKIIDLGGGELQTIEEEL